MQYIYSVHVWTVIAYITARKCPESGNSDHEEKFLQAKGMFEIMIWEAKWLQDGDEHGQPIMSAFVWYGRRLSLRSRC